ncbi:SDR family NAD(P)-dependent oxidoreductase [Variovorax sp. J22G73]|uniref:SDR family NAD(P)-dependent oxidoreductase n=1 Tax=unclassified Variovorax TaxID=663243 RepID=UPI002578F4A7|nr:MULTISPECIES: SDR family NAD(P)-dependent oxidoreductase [unclassified Variovorax]MDM0008393.1 SDR family NAD(P)-dependent oxidoreductase [Variovorax sp. J22R203]MDM0100900.1 SDR family NAD(P)-dependent oxidoreductase [Variovorax sp. J22G73]
MNSAKNQRPASKGTAVVTGASAGIGKVYADRLAQQGYDLHLVARRRDRLNALAETLSAQYGVVVRTTTADLTDPEHVLALAQVLASDVTLTMLVNNAGASVWGPIAEADPRKASAIIALNVTALTQLTIAALSAFKSSNRGTIVNIGSIAAFGIYPGVGIYSGTKAYVLNFTRTLQAELRGTNVVVQFVAPGQTMSEARELAGGSQGDAAMVMTTEDCVDASLQGLRDGEAITAPSVEGGVLVANFNDAGQALFVSALTGKPASRYAVAY